MIKISKLLLIVILIMSLYSCTTIKEAISYNRILKEISNMKFDFPKKERVSYGDDPKEFYITYSPETVTNSDVILFIHGGGWKSGSPGESEYLADYFLNRGYRVILFGYPLYPDANLEEMNKSLLNCFDTINRESTIDENTRFILGGASAGSHLAFNLYSNLIDKNSGEDLKIKAFFSLSGVLNFNECRNSIIKRLIKNISDIPSNPYDRLEESEGFPLFLLYSQDDGIVEYENSVSFGKKADSLGYDVTSLEYTGFTHDESYVYPFTGRDKKLEIFEKWLERLE